MILPRSQKLDLAVILVAGLGVVVVFFVRMHQNDVKALKGFIASYGRFDKAMPGGDGGDSPSGLDAAREAAADLQAKASFRISSLIRNDAELMAQVREVADLARREFDGVRLGQEAGTLREKRKAAYARFVALAGRSGRGER